MLSNSDEKDLKQWAQDLSACGHVRAQQVLKLLEEVEDLRKFQGVVLEQKEAADVHAENPEGR